MARSKSVHRTFIHSCGNLGLLLSGYMLDHRCDLRCIIELGEPVLPGTIRFHRPLDILHQIAEAFPLMILRALVVHIAEYPLNWLARGQYVSNQRNSNRG
jgi:hypothetical protein